MVELGIAILWLCIGVIILGAILYIALMVIRKFFPNMPGEVDYAVWAVFGILILIYLLTALAGGGGGLPRFRGA